MINFITNIEHNMKPGRFIIVCALALCISQISLAWGKHGHQIVIAVAQRHLSENAKRNISAYFDYNLQKDAVWMDTHRNDAPIAYTTAWHVYNVDANHRYDPSPRAHKGDCIKAVRDAVWCLGDYRNQTDSAVVFNVRMLIHFVGDMHCPVHSYFPGPRNFWECSIADSDFKGTFHSLYDKIPAMLYPETKPDDVAALIDNCNEEEIAAIQKGSIEDWAKSAADVNRFVYDINPVLTEVLDPDTVSKSKPVVDIELRNAGYRLALLLNQLFEK